MVTPLLKTKLYIPPPRPEWVVRPRFPIGAQSSGSLVLPHSRMMIHQPLGGFQGQASDIDIHAREVLKLRDALNHILARHTGQDVKKIARDTDRDNFMGPEQAVEFGLVDKVLTQRVEI